jgi:hypothetical protein
MSVERGGGEVQILVPVYNEGEHVLTLHKRLLEAGVEFDSLAFVYDTDEDTSLPYALELSRRDARVRAEKNALGPGAIRALTWGFSHARPGAVIVVMGDSSDKHSIIPEMVRLWREGATVVCASRYMPGGRQHGGGWLKSTLSRWAGKSLHLMGFPTCDPTNNFKLYDGAWLGRQRIESTGGFEVALELCYKAFVQGERIAELPTEWYDRTHGESRFNMRAWIPRYLRWYLRSVWALSGRVLR